MCELEWRVTAYLSSLEGRGPASGARPKVAASVDVQALRRTDPATESAVRALHRLAVREQPRLRPLRLSALAAPRRAIDFSLSELVRRFTACPARSRVVSLRSGTGTRQPVDVWAAYAENLHGISIFDELCEKLQRLRGGSRHLNSQIGGSPSRTVCNFISWTSGASALACASHSLPLVC